MNLKDIQTHAKVGCGTGSSKASTTFPSSEQFTDLLEFCTHSRTRNSSSFLPKEVSHLLCPQLGRLHLLMIALGEENHAVY
jgi:hypothetical protein